MNFGRKAFKVNVVDTGFTAIDFDQHWEYETVKDAARLVIQYATIGADGPMGTFWVRISGQRSTEAPGSNKLVY